MTTATLESGVKAQTFRLRTPLLSQGRSHTILASSKGDTGAMNVAIKCYAEGGENEFHAHAREDHTFIVLAGHARFHQPDQPARELGRNEGILIPAGALYKFETASTGAAGAVAGRQCLAAGRRRDHGRQQRASRHRGRGIRRVGESQQGIESDSDPRRILRMIANARIRTVYMQQFEKDELLPLLASNPALEFAAAKNADELRKVLPGAELLIANNRFYDEEVGRVVLEHGRDLRWIQYWTAGIERGIRFGMPRGIPVCAASGVKGPTVAEHAMLLLLASFRRFRAIEQARGRRDWIRNQMHETSRTLEGATLVVVGFGAIGQEIARKARSFDMRVITVTRAGRAGPTVDQAVKREQLHDVLPKADAVVLCLPVEPDTIRMFGDAQFARMKPDALFINVGRGELVDEEALIRALKARRIGSVQHSTSPRSSRCRRTARCGASTMC